MNYKSTTGIPAFKYRVEIFLSCFTNKTRREIWQKLKRSGISEWTWRKIRTTFAGDDWSPSGDDLEIITGVLKQYNPVFEAHLGGPITSVNDIKNSFNTTNSQSMPNKKRFSHANNGARKINSK